MRFLFDLNSPFMQFVSRFCDLVVLNLVYLLTCLPIFTIGAAPAALYATVFPMDTDREGKLLPTYFRAFGENFKQGTVVFLLLALFGAATYYNMVALASPDAALGYGILIVAVAIALVLCFVWAWVFPLISRFRNTIPAMLKNALLLAVGNLPRTLFVTVLNVFPWALLIVNLYAFLRLGFLWFSLYFSAAAYYNSRILKKPFDSLV